MKLPFAVPDEPIVQTLAEWIDSNGGNAFKETTLPTTSIKLIQAMGRLIRTESDVGMVTILDTDLYYTVSNDGMNGALASNREGTKSVKSKTCCEDIYFIKERKLEIDLNLVVMDKTTEIKGAQVELVELIGKSKGTSTDQVNEENGMFTFPFIQTNHIEYLFLKKDLLQILLI